MKFNCFLLLTSMFFLSCEDDTSKELGEISFEEGEFSVNIDSILVRDTSVISASATVETEGDLLPFDKYGFIIIDSQEISDTLIIGEEEEVSSFNLDIPSLKRNSKYIVKAFALSETSGIKISSSIEFYTKAFVLDSISPSSVLPEEFIYLYGQGLSDFEMETPLFLKNRSNAKTIKANVKGKGDGYVLFTYEEPEDNDFFKDGSIQSSNLTFNYRDIKYQSESIGVYTYRPIITSLNKDTIKIGETLKIDGYFGNYLREVYLNDELVPSNYNSFSVWYSSINGSYKYHKTYQISINIIEGLFKPGTYVLSIKVKDFGNDFICYAPNKIVVIQ